MIYLNHAGTSWPLPKPVAEAMAQAVHKPVSDWPEEFARGHRAIANWLGVDDPTRLLLTPGCTAALAVGIADHPWVEGDQIVTGSFEHHALARPMTLLADRVELVTVPPDERGPFDLETYERALETGRVRLVATAWASNVTGAIAPVEAIVARAHAHGVPVLLDAAQVAGWLHIDVSALGVDLLAFAGHKGPQAPWGIGGLYVAPHVRMSSPAAVCEVRADGAAPSCASMPGYCDTGSVDRIALAGLEAGIAHLAARPGRLLRARQQIGRLTESLPGNAVIYGPRDPADKVPTLAFRLENGTPQQVASRLRELGVHVASGLMCAPQAHESLGTDPLGVVRISVGPDTSDRDIDEVIAALQQVGTAIFQSG